MLVVDDDADILRMIERYLCAAGMDVITNDSPFGVSSLVSREDPAVIVLDVNMPALDGESVASLLGEGRLTRDVSVVFYSAMGEADLEELASRIPRATFVTKTAGLAALKAEVVRAAKKTPVRKTARR